MPARPNRAAPYRRRAPFFFPPFAALPPFRPDGARFEPDRFAVERLALERLALDRFADERVDLVRFTDDRREERFAADRPDEVDFRAAFLAVPDFFALLRFLPAVWLLVPAVRVTGRRAAGRSIPAGSPAAAALAADPAAGAVSS